MVPCGRSPEAWGSSFTCGVDEWGNVMPILELKPSCIGLVVLHVLICHVHEGANGGVGGVR